MKRATLGGHVVGLSMLKDLGGGVGYVYYLAVLPEFRGRKVGGRLLDDALAQFSSQGDARVYATVEEDNGPSLSLFESRGFVETSYDEMSRIHGRLKSVYMMYEMQAVAGEVVLCRQLGN
ncbi:MAG TPA: GNAT family N-acetyltransferase [Conexivisphaerales archaeon]|nr:GNAT family N-acetyltransferase [Conexivisphaerales archaeon]